MDYQKCGKFLIDLRKKKGLTQQELADKLNYSNKTISRWERGDSFPTDIAVLKILSKELDVSIEELMYGERKTKDNSKNVDDIIVKEYEKQHSSLKKSKFKNKIFLLITILIIISSMFLILYFGFFKNSLKIYKLNIDDNDNILKSFEIILIETKDKTFLNFDKIETNDDAEIDFIRLYYIDGKEEKEIISFDNDNIFLEELNGYNEYNLDGLGDTGLKLELVIDNKKNYFELHKELLYTNSKLFPDTKENISNNNLSKRNTENNYSNFLINERFEEVTENLFQYEDDDTIVNISLEDMSIKIIVNKNNLSLNIMSWLNNDVLHVIDYNRINENTEFNSITEEKNCQIELCDKAEDYVMYINYFKNNY